jgi:hypothetical protein
MTPEAFWSLPRSTRPEQVFGELAAQLPVPLPRATLPLPSNIVVRGAGGGVWSSRLVEGRLVMATQAQHPALGTLTLERATLRELVGGSLRDRGLAVMAALGRPRALPDLSRLPVRAERAVALAALRGSVALLLVDRDLAETHRLVWTCGDAEPAWEQATTTVRLDADEVVGWIAARADPRAVLRSSAVRVEGDLTLPLRALGLLLDP